MLLKEMFSAIGAPKEQDQEIDWLDDLKYFIDNEDGTMKKKLKNKELIELKNSMM